MVETMVRLHPDDLEILATKLAKKMAEARSVPERSVDINELSIVVGIPKSTLYKLSMERRKNGFPCGKAGKSLAFKISDVQDWIRKH
jgi:predicted DNA-binding transcriptional regulator AlpA